MPDGIQPPYFDPSQYPAYIDMQRKQQLAQMLMQSAQQSNQTPADWNSMKVVPRKSPLDIVGSLASALLAGKANQSALQSQKDYFNGMYGGGQPSAPQPSDMTSSPGTSTVNLPGQPGMNVPSGNVPGTGSQPSGAPSMLPPGMTAQQASMIANLPGGAAELSKAMIAQLQGTPEWQNALRAAGGNQQLALQYMQRSQLKAGYIAPIEQRAGAVERDPITNQVIGQNPTLPEGSIAQFDASGRPTSVATLPGSEAATAAAAAGKAAGTVSQTPIKVGTDANGRDVFVFPHPPAMGAGSGAPGGSIGAGGTSSGGGQTASPAVVESQQKGAEHGQAYASELSKNATGATEIRRSLSELRNLAGQAKPGAANQAKMQLGSYMIAAGMSPESAAQFLGVDVGALQAAQKQTSTLAVGVIHSMTNRGTNFDLETFMRNNPNLNMADPSAFNRVVDYMDGKAKQEIAKQKDFVQWKKGVSPDEWEGGHTAHWLEQQNAQIDQGRSNSRPPLSSFVTR